MVAHPWEQQEIALQAQSQYANPHTDVEVWVDLEGPGFGKRCYGFWDGGGTFRVRIVGTRPGLWKWLSGSEPYDPGLSGKSGSFEVTPWDEEQLAQNPNRRGVIRATANGYGIE